MGFPTSWRRNPLWSQSYRPDQLVRQRLKSIDELETLTPDETARLLRFTTPKRARENLDYLRKKHAVIGVKVTPGGIRYFPIFQIDREPGQIRPVVISANRKLFVLNAGADTDEHHWLALSWWMSPEPRLEGHCPADALMAGQLDQPALDALLPGPEE